MGLLDALFPSGGGNGGLLDLIRQSQPNFQMGGLPSDQAQYQPTDAMAQAPQFAPQAPQQPMQATPQQPMAAPQIQPAPQVAQPAPQSPSPGIGDRLSAGFQSFANSGGPLQAIANGIGGAITGHRMDEHGIAQQQQAKVQNQTMQWLLQRGADPVTAQAAIGNPKVLESLIKQMEPKAVTSLGEGYVTDKNGNVTRAYTPEEKTPTSVLEYNYYKGHPTPGQPVMDYGTWASKKARDAITQDPAASKTLTPGGEIYHMENGKVVVDHKNDKSASADDTPQSTIDFLADRTRLGDQKHLVGLTRVPGLVARVQTAADQREAAGIPISAEAKSVVNNATSLGARRSAENNLSGINNRNEVFGNNALGALDIAVKASADVPRSQYPKVNEAINAYRTNTGDPKVVALGAALNTVVNDYARFAGGGIGSDALRGEAERILNQGHSHEQVVAIADMMKKEIKRGQQSPGMVRSTFDTLYGPGGTGNGGNGAAPETTAPAGGPKEGDIAHNPQTGETIIRKSGKWLPFS